MKMYAFPRDDDVQKQVFKTSRAKDKQIKKQSPQSHLSKAIVGTVFLVFFFLANIFLL